MGRRWIIAGIGLAVCLAVARADTDSLLVSLQPQGYVSDFAGVMRSEDREATERLLAEVALSNGNQIAVVTVRSLDGGPIDDFAHRLFEHWGIGRKGQNDGILLLAAIEDRKVRIETGYGVEGILPDAATGRLLDQHVLPAFKRGDYSGGLRSGAEALAAVVRSGTAPSAQKETRTQPGGCGILFIIVVILLFIRSPWLMIHVLLSLGSSRGGGGGFGGGGFGGSSFGGFGGGMSGGGGASRGW